ncbi:MAG: S9 family peptidase [Bryobacteraceae bacterium]|nr:S9 family peptidase [Bryobacteraceae bacterium]
MARRYFLLLLLGTALIAARFDLHTPGRIVRVGDPQIAPDGKSIVITVSRANFQENRWDADLVLVDTATKAQRILTSGKRGLANPRWSPDGASLGFLANVEGKAQVFVLPLGGGDSRQVTKSPTGVQNYSWRPDSKAIAFNAFDEDPKKEGEDRFNRAFEVQNNHYLMQEAPKASHLWIQTLDGGPARRLTSGTWTLPIAFPPGPPPPAAQWSADGKSLVIVRMPTVYSGDFDKSTIQVVDAETGAMRPLTGRARNETQPVVSPDGKLVTYWFPRGGETKNVNEIWVTPLSGGEGRSLTSGLDRHILRAIWTPDSKALLLAANERTTTGIYFHPLDGAARKVDVGNLVASGGFGLDASIANDGRIALVASEPHRPAELYILSNPAARPERLTDFNAHIAALELGKTETVEWDFENFRQDGVVTYPPDFQAGRKYPLVLYIHGGPRSASKEAFSPRAQLMAAQGWVVFEPNYRGSDNRGNAFQAAIWNDAGAGPGRDVMSGLDLLKKRGFVDESRIGVSGWSYGGYMTTWLIGNYPGVWKAAVAGAAVTDGIHQYDLGDSNVRRGASYGGSPYTDPKRMQAFIAQSPITYIPQARTPTLILALTGDYRVPPTQSYRLYHALRDNNVPVKFFAYPLPGHNAADPVHQRDIDKRWIEWFRTYLDGAAPSGN